MRNLSLLLSLVLLVLTQTCSAFGPRTNRLDSTKVTDTVPTPSALSIPRGGAIMPVLSQDAAVKTFLGIFGLNGITGILTPEFPLGTYKMQIDDFSSFMAQDFCGVSMNIVVLLGLQLFRGMPFEKAVGYSTLPYICMTVAKLLTHKHDTVSCPRKNAYLVLVINAAVAIASLLENALAAPLIKLYALFSLVNGVPLFFSPKTGGDMWNLTPETAQNTLLLQWQGYGLLTHFVSLLPAFGLLGDIYENVGWVSATMSASLVGLFGLGKLKILQTVPVLVWITLLTAITLSLL